MKRMILSVLGAMGVICGAKADFGPSDYEQENLVAQWDCADSTHIDSTGWTDTSGQYKFVFEGDDAGSITWDNTGVYFPLNAAGFLADNTQTFGLAGNGTLEIVYAETGNNKAAGNGSMLLQSDTTTKIGLMLNTPYESYNLKR